jgi:single-strand DNA-binding protein
MAFDNTVTVTGNITRDPELRYTAGGSSVTNFGLAWNRRYQRNGEQVEETSFFDVTCWRELGENVAESLSKGMRVVVNGRLDQRSWENKEGDRRSKVEIVADEVAPSLRWATAQVTRTERTDGGSGGGGGDGRPAPAAAPAPSHNYDEEPF